MDHFPTVSTCSEVSSYDLQGNAVSRFYCPEKEMGVIKQGEAEQPRPSGPPPLLPPQLRRGPSGRPGLPRGPRPLRAVCVRSLPPNCRAGRNNMDTYF